MSMEFKDSFMDFRCEHPIENPWEMQIIKAESVKKADRWLKTNLPIVFENLN